MQYKHNQPRPDRAGDEAPADGIIEGRNAVIEALRAGTQIDKIFIMKGEVDTALGHIASTARSQGIVVADADKRKLDGMSRTHAHQGVIAAGRASGPTPRWRTSSRPPGTRGRPPCSWSATSSPTPIT